MVVHAEDATCEARSREPEEVAAVHLLDPAGLNDRSDVPAYLETDIDQVEAVRVD